VNSFKALGCFILAGGEVERSWDVKHTAQYNRVACAIELGSVLNSNLVCIWEYNKRSSLQPTELAKELIGGQSSEMETSPSWDRQCDTR